MIVSVPVKQPFSATAIEMETNHYLQLFAVVNSHFSISISQFRQNSDSCVENNCICKTSDSSINYCDDTCIAVAAVAIVVAVVVVAAAVVVVALDVAVAVHAWTEARN